MQLIRCVSFSSDTTFPFQQPEKIQVFELRQQVFPVKLIIIEKMLQGIAGLPVFINAEKVIPLAFGKLDLYAVVLMRKSNRKRLFSCQQNW